MGRKEIAKNTLIFTFSTMASRILGFVRDILIAKFFGATPVADAFFVAFRIPNLFRRLLGEGALSSAFIPVFSQYEKEKGNIKTVLDSAFSTLIIVLAILVLLGEVFTSSLVKIIAPGLRGNIFTLTVNLTKITFPYIGFMGTAILIGAALNHKKDFFYTSFSPCLLNICMIIALLLSQRFPQPIKVLAWGVFTGGIVQMLFHLYGAKKLNVLPNPVCKPFHPEVVKALKLMAPATAGLAIHQINTLIDTVLASFLVAGSISFLYYANRLFQLPLALFGIAIGAVLLPYAADAVSSGRKKELIDNIRFSLEFVMWITIPAAVGLVILSFPIIDLLFRRGEFSITDAHNTASALSMYALGLPFISAIKVVVSVFHSHMDMKTPVKAAALALVANIMLNLILMKPLKHAGLALATSLSSLIQLSYLMAKANSMVKLKEIVPKNWVKIIFVNFAFAFLLFISTKSLKYPVNENILARGTFVFGIILIFSTTYFAISSALKIVVLQRIRD